jgi:hypothetical protein
VKLHTRFKAEPGDDSQAVITLCHNDHCGVRQGFTGAATNITPQPGDLGFTSTISVPAEGEIDVIFEPDVPAAALQDGDRYSLLVKHGSRVLASTVQAVTYEVSFPNGPECDAHACRKLVLEVP